MFHYSAKNLTRQGEKDVCSFSARDKRPWEEIENDPLRTFSCAMESRKCEFEGCNRRTRKALPYCFWHQRSVLHLIIKKSKIPGAGLGLFACGNTEHKGGVVFKKGDVVALYARKGSATRPTIGEWMDNETGSDRYGECLTAPYGVDSPGKLKFVDTACQRSIASYANGALSADKANTTPEWQQRGRNLVLVAKRNIHDGEELLWWYGNDYRHDYPMEFEHRVWHTRRPETSPKCHRRRRRKSSKRR